MKIRWTRPHLRKVALLPEIDASVRTGSAHRQASINLGASGQAVEILRPDGKAIATSDRCADQYSVVAGQGGRRENGYKGSGGRAGYETFIDPRRGARRPMDRRARPW